jgi:multidrug resistance efflux pump
MKKLRRRLRVFFPPRVVRTCCVLAVAVIVLIAIWRDYLYSPWTRDGRVNAEVANIAPEIADNVVDIPVVDNQVVHKGDILIVIDPARYRFALAEAQARVENRKQVLIERQFEATRRASLVKTEAVSMEEKQLADMTSSAAQADYNDALAAQDLAKLDLARTVIRSPVNGWVINLHARVGDYATPGKPLLSVLDADSFWIAAYMEETKLAHIQEGDQADVRLMGVSATVQGHVESLSGGIQDQNQENFTGLAAVNPIFTWVRLAQRIPVRIHIDHVPREVHIRVGQTCTVQIKPDTHPVQKQPLQITATTSAPTSR